MSANTDIFDILSKQNISENKSDIFDQLAKSQPSRARSIVSAPIKGALKEVSDIPAQLRNVPFIAAPGLASTGPIPNELVEKLLEDLLPTQQQPLERGLERGGRLAVGALGGEEGLALKALRSGLGAIGGQTAEEFGMPKWVQSLAELSAFASPKFGGKILPKKSQKEAVEFLREKGFSEKQIAPLIKSNSFINRWIGKLSEKGEKTKKLGKEISSDLGNIYENLKMQGQEKFLPNNKAVKFDDLLSESVGKISPAFGRLIEKDLETLRNKGISQRTLIDFYQDINRVVGKEQGGKAVLNILKEPVIKGLQEIDPKAAKDFAMANKFYGRAKELENKLTPNVLESLFSKTKSLALLGSLALLKFKMLPGLIGTTAAQKVMRELTINPRLQNLSYQSLKAISQNKIPAALQVMKQFSKELRKSDEESADIFNQILETQEPLNH